MEALKMTESEWIRLIETRLVRDQRRPVILVWHTGKHQNWIENYAKGAKDAPRSTEDS